MQKLQLFFEDIICDVPNIIKVKYNCHGNLVSK